MGMTVKTQRAQSAIGNQKPRDPTVRFSVLCHLSSVSAFQPLLSTLNSQTINHPRSVFPFQLFSFSAFQRLVWCFQRFSF